MKQLKKRLLLFELSFLPDWFFVFPFCFDFVFLLHHACRLYAVYFHLVRNVAALILEDLLALIKL